MNNDGRETGQNKYMNTIKYRAMNWLRVLAFLFIILYHFMIELEQTGSYVFDNKSVVYYANANLHIAIIGVSLFFMISGAGLMLSSRKRWNVKDFYKRRFTKLLIPFYIVELFTLVASFSIKREWISYFPEVSKVKVVFNLLGMDGYFEQYFTTYCLHVGEWFLGALIMLYALFPLFRFCIEKNRYITISIATIYYLIMILGGFSSITPWTNVFVKAYDFVLGMFLILEIPKIMEHRTAKIAIRIMAAIVILFGMIYKPAVPIPFTITNLLYAAVIFIFFFSMETVWGKCEKADRLIDRICLISYEIFLVHHIVIYYIGDNIAGPMTGGIWQVVALFITEIIIMVSLAFSVRSVAGWINNRIDRC